MPRKESTYLRLITAAVFIVLEIAAVGLLKKTSTLQNIWLNKASYRTMSVLWSNGEKFGNYFKLQDINDNLAEENFRLRLELQNARDALTNTRLYDSLKRFTDNRFLYIPAQVIKISRNSQHNYIIINKGYSDGITPHSGIITGKGIVGIIDAVDAHYSYGLSLMNTRTSVSVRVGQDGIVCPLVWNGKTSNGAILKDVPIQGAVSKGDTVLTSGLSSVFPGNLPVGVVSKEPWISGSSKKVTIDLFQDFATLKYVIITSDPERQEIKELEKKEEDR